MTLLINVMHPCPAIYIISIRILYIYILILFNFLSSLCHGNMPEADGSGTSGVLKTERSNRCLFHAQVSSYPFQTPITVFLHCLTSSCVSQNKSYPADTGKIQMNDHIRNQTSGHRSISIQMQILPVLPQSNVLYCINCSLCVWLIKFSIRTFNLFYIYIYILLHQRYVSYNLVIPLFRALFVIFFSFLHHVFSFYFRMYVRKSAHRAALILVERRHCLSATRTVIPT